MTSAAIIIPWRDKGDPWRKANLEVVVAHLQSICAPQIAIVSDGRLGDEPFNRSAAYNLGIRGLRGIEVFVFHEADMLVSRAQLDAAVDMAARSPGLVVPFDTYHYLSAEATGCIHQGANPADARPEYVMANGRSIGAVNAVSVETLIAVGQWDERFSGWGFDDRAMDIAFALATGERTRFVPGSGTHLWHTPGWSANSRFRGGADVPRHEAEATVANEARYRLYRRATTPQRIRELTAGGS